MLLEDGLYPYLLQPEEEHDDQRKRAMGRICSKKTYRLKEVVEDSGNRVMYYLSDEPERTLVSERLMLIPEDTDLLKTQICLLITSKNGNIYLTGIDIAS